jgi:hypothetical protein
MHLTALSVTFKKVVSDGNYGSETAEVTFTASLDETDDFEGHVNSRWLLEYARESAQWQLAQSPNMAVRRALVRQEPPQQRPAHADEVPF